MGPGPFTGLRVGIVSAAALGDALGVPVHGVCSLDALALAAVGPQDAGSGNLLVVTDARRRETYWAAYDSEADADLRQARRLTGPSVEAPLVLADRLAELGIARAVGDPSFAETLGIAVGEPHAPTPYGLVAVAAGALRSGADPAPLEPLYLRRPDAVEPTGRKRVTGAMSAPAAGGHVTLGPLYRSDAERCAELERILFPGDDPWSAQAFRDELTTGHLYLGLRDPGGRLIGYGGLAFVAGPPQAEAEVHTIGVDPARQGHGLGRRLLDGLLEGADQVRATVFLEVRTDNEPARGLYEVDRFRRRRAAEALLPAERRRRVHDAPGSRRRRAGLSGASAADGRAPGVPGEQRHDDVPGARRRCLVPGPVQGVERRARDRRGDGLAVREREQRVGGAVQHQRRDGDVARARRRVVAVGDRDPVVGEQRGHARRPLDGRPGHPPGALLVEVRAAERPLALDQVVDDRVRVRPVRLRRRVGEHGGQRGIRAAAGRRPAGCNRSV